jgi:hypothetical protein
MPAEGRKIKCRRKDGIKIEKSERRNQEIFFVYTAELHRLDAVSSHQQDSDPHHSKQQNDSQRTEVPLHTYLPFTIRFLVAA